MSQPMEQAFQKARQLPESDQEAIASIILQEIEADRRWKELFSRPESADLLSKMADEALQARQAYSLFQQDPHQLEAELLALEHHWTFLPLPTRISRTISASDR